MASTQRRVKRRDAAATNQPGAEETRPQEEHVYRWCLVVFCTALLLRVVHLLNMDGSPLFGVLLGESRTYDAWAREIAAGDWIGHEVFYQAPLYPYFLACLYKVLGHEIMAVRIVQVLIGSGSCVLLTLAGRRFFSVRVGIVAGLILAAYPPAIFFDAIIQKACLGMFCMSLLVLLFARLVDRASWRSALGAGLVLGCFALTRENALLLFPVIALWLVIDSRHAGWRKRVVCAGIFSLGVVAVLLPVVIRNRAVGGQFQLTTSQSGPNFFIGNNAEADGSYRPIRPWRGDAAFERSDAAGIAESDLGRELTPAEVSGYWLGCAFDYIRSEPGDWFRLMLKKTYYFWNVGELDDTESIRAHQEWSWVLRVPRYVLHFGVLVPLAAVGLFATRDRWRQLSVLYLVGATFAASVIVFYVLARYRAPLIPLTVLFASAGIVWIVRRVRVGGFVRDLVPYAVILPAAGLLANYPQWEPRFPVAMTYANVGAALMESGKSAEALRWFTVSVERNPLLEMGHYGLAEAEAAAGKLDSAIRGYTKALELRPDFGDAHFGLAAALQSRGSFEDAAEHYEKTIALNPGMVEAHHNLGYVLGKLGRSAAGVRSYEEAVAIDPDFEQAHYNLGFELARMDRLSKAAEHFEAVIRIDPLSVRGHHQLARVLSRLEQLEAADRHFVKAVALQPGNANLHADYAQLLAAQRRFAKARAHLVTALRINPNHSEARDTLDWIERAEER